MANSSCSACMSHSWSWSGCMAARRYSPLPRPLLCLCLALRFIFRLSAMSFAVRCLRRFSRPSDLHYCFAIRPFYIFSANFVSLPQTWLAGTVNFAGVYLPVAQLVGGVIAIALTVALHILLTHSTIGSRLLAVAEDRAAAMLMGIRPDRMQMLAWGLSAGAAGIAGALMATAYPWSPSVGETFGLIAFVVVALGGFGSVLGSLYAGLIIGLIQAISAFWLGAIYKDIVVYGLFVALLWFRPQGLMGKA